MRNIFSLLLPEMATVFKVLWLSNSSSCRQSIIYYQLHKVILVSCGLLGEREVSKMGGTKKVKGR